MDAAPASDSSEATENTSIPTINSVRGLRVFEELSEHFDLHLFDPDRPWIVLVWNDPINLMTYVTYVFMSYFHYPREKAEQLMLAVNEEERAVLAEFSSYLGDRADVQIEIVDDGSDDDGADDDVSDDDTLADDDTVLDDDTVSDDDTLPGSIDLGTDADTSFTGEAADDAAGISVDGAGDVDGDGYDDIIIGGSAIIDVSVAQNFMKPRRDTPRSRSRSERVESSTMVTPCRTLDGGRIGAVARPYRASMRQKCCRAPAHGAEI